MSYAVVHMQKFKINSVKGIQFHNQRERESRTNPDIDKTKSHLNYDLANSENIDFNKKIKNIIKNNVKTDRAIRKDAVVMCNFVITSDKKFFDNIGVKERERFFKESYKFFSDRYGENNIIASNVHLDEKTPHMHLSIVPVTSDNKLSAKRLLDRNELRSIQDNFPKFIQSKGFDLKRGIDAEGKNKHIDTQKLKVIELDQRNKSLLEEQEKIKKVIDKLESEKEINQDLINSYKDIPKGKNTITGNIKLSKEDYEQLIEVNRAFINEHQENINLKKEISSLKRDSYNTKIINKELEKQIKELTLENKRLLATLSKINKVNKLFYNTINKIREPKNLNEKGQKAINSIIQDTQKELDNINKPKKSQKQNIEIDM